MTKIQNRQRTQTNMKTLFVQELWNSRVFIPRTQRKVFGLPVKWSCVNNIIMGSDPANTWLDVHSSSCTSLVLLTSVPRFVTRKFRICRNFAGLGLATAKCGSSPPQQRRCNARFEIRSHHKKSKSWIYQNKYLGEIEVSPVLYYLAENYYFLSNSPSSPASKYLSHIECPNIPVKLWNVHAQL